MDRHGPAVNSPDPNRWWRSPPARPLYFASGPFARHAPRFNAHFPARLFPVADPGSWGHRLGDAGASRVDLQGRPLVDGKVHGSSRGVSPARGVRGLARAGAHRAVGRSARAPRSRSVWGPALRGLESPRAALGCAVRTGRPARAGRPLVGPTGGLGPQRSQAASCLGRSAAGYPGSGIRSPGPRRVARPAPQGSPVVRAL